MQNQESSESEILKINTVDQAGKNLVEFTETVDVYVIDKPEEFIADLKKELVKQKAEALLKVFNPPVEKPEDPAPELWCELEMDE
jgi:hypothetical protein